jgi:hypothetical protein
MSPASHFFYVLKPKSSTEKNPFANNVVYKQSGKFLVPPEKFPDCFQTSTVISNKFVIQFRVGIRYVICQGDEF